MVSVGVIGASGFVGGELLRLLARHPHITSVQAASDTFKGQPVGTAHPNLRALENMYFIGRGDIEPCDVVFLATPHGFSSANTTMWMGLAPVVIDLSADFRLKDAEVYQRYYGLPHPAQKLCSRFTTGIPELFREQIASADLIAGPGCTALASILALIPAVEAGIIAPRVFVDAKVGSSGSGSKPGPSTHHPLRAGSARVFKPSGHRHEAEISTICRVTAYETVSSVDLVRGVLVAIYCDLLQLVSESEIRRLYRDFYLSQPFTRVVKRKPGSPYALPEPKLLAGTNGCDVGFALSLDGKVLIAFAALDNLTKGAAGNAVQCMNIRLSFPETAGLNLLSPHPM